MDGVSRSGRTFSGGPCALAAALLAAACLVPGADCRASGAVAFKQNVAHDGRAVLGGPAPVFPLPMAWSADLGGAAEYPLAVGGRVFAVSATGGGVNVRALDAASGTLLWGPLFLPSFFSYALQAYDNGTLFVVTSDLYAWQGTLTALDAVTGEVRWTAALPGQYAFRSPPTAQSGVVYVAGAGGGGTLYAVEEGAGTLLWTQEVMNGDASSPALSGKSVFVSYPCQVYAFNRASGDAEWQYAGPCSGGGGFTPVYAGGKLYVLDWTASPRGAVYDAGTGTALGSFDSDQVIPAIGEATGYFVASGVLRAIDLATGATLWSFAGEGSPVLTSPLVLDGQYVLVGTGAGRLYALGAATGQVMWREAIASPPSGMWSFWAPAAGGGLVLVPSGNTLVAYGTPCPAMEIGPEALTDVTAGTPYGQVLSAAGGQGPYTYAVTGGALPPGITLGASGTLGGTATAVGAYDFSVTATDAAGCEGERRYTLAVRSPYDLALADDSGRSRLCVNRATGDYRWEVLGGPGAGSVFTGRARLTERFPGRVEITAPLESLPPFAFSLSVVYRRLAHTAVGYHALAGPAGTQHSPLSDGDTRDDPPCGAGAEPRRMSVRP